MSEDLITVIVPVYNAEKYLDECLKSIINQDYKNLEIMLVNDGSTDTSPEICKSYAARDTRIKYYSKENGGHSSARNYALDRMTGDYVSFVDADDWLAQNFYSELHKLAKEHDADIACCVEFFNPEDAASPAINYPVHVYTMNEYAELLIPDVVMSHVINKLFRSNIFSNNTDGGGGIRFSITSRSTEDMRIFPSILRGARKVVLTDSPLYFYRIHIENTSHKTAQTPINSMERALIFIERYSMADGWVSDTKPLILKKAVWFGISAYTWFNGHNAQTYSAGYETIRKFFVEHKDEIAASQLIDKPRKLAAKLIIANIMLPFKLMSCIRPVAKRAINMLQGTSKEQENNI